jgi:hypothetical protein
VAVVGDIFGIAMRGRVIRSVRCFAVIGVWAASSTSACTPPATPPVSVSVTDPGLEVPRLDGGGGESPSGIRFHRAVPAVGARWTVTTRAHSASTFQDGQGPDLQISEYLSTYAVEVLAVSGPAVARVRVAFEKNVQRYQSADRPTVLHGKTYIVDVTAPPVRDEGGGAATAEETERVLDNFPELGTRTQIDQVLPDVGMKIGESRHEVAAAVLAVIHPRAWTLHEGTAVLERSSGDEAVFAVTLDATGRNGVRMTVKGLAQIRLRDSRLVGVHVEGTYLPQAAVGDAGTTGTFVLDRTVEGR